MLNGGVTGSERETASQSDGSGRNTSQMEGSNIRTKMVVCRGIRTEGFRRWD